MLSLGKYDQFFKDILATLQPPNQKSVRRLVLSDMVTHYSQISFLLNMEIHTYDQIQTS